MTDDLIVRAVRSGDMVEFQFSAPISIMSFSVTDDAGNTVWELIAGQNTPRPASVQGLKGSEANRGGDFLMAMPAAQVPPELLAMIPYLQQMAAQRLRETEP